MKLHFLLEGNSDIVATIILRLIKIMGNYSQGGAVQAIKSTVDRIFEGCIML